MISKPNFSDSELYCIKDAVKAYKKECEKMYKALPDCADEKEDVLGEMDDIMIKIKSYSKENANLSKAIRSLLYKAN